MHLFVQCFSPSVVGTSDSRTSKLRSKDAQLSLPRLTHGPLHRSCIPLDPKRTKEHKKSASAKEKILQFVPLLSLANGHLVQPPSNFPLSRSDKCHRTLFRASRVVLRTTPRISPSFVPYTPSLPPTGSGLTSYLILQVTLQSRSHVCLPHIITEIRLKRSPSKGTSKNFGSVFSPVSSAVTTQPSGPKLGKWVPAPKVDEIRMTSCHVTSSPSHNASLL